MDQPVPKSHRPALARAALIALALLVGACGDADEAPPAGVATPEATVASTVAPDATVATPAVATASPAATPTPSPAPERTVDASPISDAEALMLMDALIGVPYVFGVVRLEEGLFLTTNVVGADPAEIHIGMPVEVVFDDVTDEIAIPRFRPVVEA